MELTVACGCGRKMAPNYRAGPGRFRCGCGAAITVSGLPTERTDRCPVRVEGKICNREKPPVADACGQCVERIARTALARPDLRDRLLRGDIAASFARAQDAAFAEDRQRSEDEQRRRRVIGALTQYNVVYYVRVRPEVIKIGTTRHLRSRMGALRVLPTDVLAAEPGTRQLEATRHRQFAHLQTGAFREDFTEADDLRAHIAAIVDQHGQPYDLADQIEQSQRALLS